MGSYFASFARRRLPPPLESAFFRTSADTDVGLDGSRSVVASGLPAFNRVNGAILGAGATQLLYNTGFAGAAAGSPGTAPTGWSNSQSSGTIQSVDTIDLGNSLRLVTSNARRSFTIPQTVTVQTYCWSAVIVINSGQAQFNQVLDYSVNTAVVSAVSYRVNGVVVAGSTLHDPGTYIVERIISVTTGGEMYPRLGLGTASNQTGDITVKYPQFEAGLYRTSYIYNTSTSAALVRQPAYISSTLSALGVANQNIGYTLAGVVQFPFPKGVLPESYPRLMGVGATAASDRFEVLLNPNSGRIYAALFGAGAYIGETATTAGEIDWAAGEPVFFAASWGTADGLVLVTRKPDGTTYVDTNTGAPMKAAHSNAMTHAAIQGHIVTGAWENTGGTATWRGALFADRAYSQAELLALRAEHFQFRSQRMPLLGVGVGMGL